MASEIKVDTVSEKTSGSGVTIDGLLIKDGGISGDVSLIGTTPTFTIGDAGAEDAALVFDGNAQDFYIALDDSADDLLIGLGSTVGTTPAISIDENLQVKIVATTASTSATTGSLIAAGGAGIAADLHVGDDLTLISDSAVLGFGADKDTTLTHTDGTGLTLNSTNKLCFNDASQFIQGSSATVLSIGATDEIDLTATAVDLNGTLNVSGVATFQAAPVFPDGSIAVADLDIDGGTDIGADIVDADLFIVDDGAGGTNRKTAASRLKTYIGSSPLVLLGTLTTNNSATGNLTIDNIFSSTYDHYIITGFAAPSNSNEALQFQFRTGSSGSNATLENVYCFIVNHARIDSNDATGSDIAGEYNAAAAKISNHGVAVDGSTKLTSFDMVLSDPNTNLMGRSNWHGNCTYQNPTNDRHFNGTFGGSTTSNPNATGITFSYSANNIQYGRITIYGVKHA